MAYTTLHRAVGAAPGRVTADMLQRAVDAQLGEDEDLDWKLDVDPSKGREITKDFAAMANASGGVIITGVGEDGADHAASLPGLAESQAASLVTRFQQQATSLVRPFIPALKVYTVRLPASPGMSAVVVEIPRSPESPHLVMWEKTFWGYPKRSGAHTVWLGETDVEAAYRRRFALRQDAEAKLQLLCNELRDRNLVHQPRHVWIAVAAVCSMPASFDTAPAVDVSKADPVMTEILGVLPAGESLLQQKLRSAHPMVGLRRAIFTPSLSRNNGQSSSAHLELHHDASFAGALAVNSPTTTSRNVLLPRLHLESAVRDLVAAAAVHASRRGGDGTLQLQAQIITRSPVALADRGGTYDEQIDGSIALDGSIPAQAPSPVTSEAPLEDLLVPGRRAAVARQLLLDLTHQFAVADLLRP